MNKHSEIINFVKKLYPSSPVSLHEPRFIGKEKEYLADCIDSTYVSSVGSYVTKFENMVAQYTGIKHAIATSNGTSALHVSLLLAGVRPNEEVITQAVTFVATANSISYCSAHPVLIDSDPDTLGMCPDKLNKFLETNAELHDDGLCYNKKTMKVIRACIPMHALGHSVRLDEIEGICKRFNIALVEDAAEALGSFYKGAHVGQRGKISTLSFNGNKIITTGGGGMILTNDDDIARKAKHLTTTAKLPHSWEFEHDDIGFNYRMPNLNAALGCAQLENLDFFIKDKRETADIYEKFFHSLEIKFIKEPKNCKSNYWLNAIKLKNAEDKDSLLKLSQSNSIGMRPLWKNMHKLQMYKDCQKTSLEVAENLYDTIVCLPSSVKIK